MTERRRHLRLLLPPVDDDTPPGDPAAIAHVRAFAALVDAIRRTGQKDEE